ncbi:MAG TPA: MraY family glycosyltransferase [Acidimicrobiales bacterium]|nr:MraY family glycosyltransferase [Acidimicrobiales bacterium]
MSTAVIIAVASAVITAVAVPGCIVIAHRFGVIDRPGPLKPHEAPVAYLGGVAVFAGLVVGVSAGRPITLIPLAAATALGVTDDRFELPAPLRLAAQLGVGAIIAFTVPIHLPGWIGIPLVVIASVVLINAFNLLDGLDMLASGVGAAAAVGFAIVTHGPARLMAASLAGALASFLWFNRPPARIYLGDGGSYLLGAAMSVLLAYTWGIGVPVSTGVIALALLAVPVTEVASAIVRRHRGKRPLLAGDRAHPYDLLVARGWTRVAASGAYIALEVMMVVVVCIVVGVGGASVPAVVGIDLAVAVVVLGSAGVAGGFGDHAGSMA